ncbi:MAG TPA: sulfur carrier protein ThiS [Bryobacteraceae bacterium]|nr:sulfur carrier protein ThiS [Bryobacteraceae bacterium]
MTLPVSRLWIISMEISGTKTIQIVVNGHVREIPAGQALAETLVYLDVDPSRVAVELNRAIVSRSAWSEIQVGEGATLEIVQFVGGG